VTVYKETHPRTGKPRYRIHVEWTYPDGSKRTVRKVSPIRTQRGAEQYERDVRNALAAGTWGKRAPDSTSTLAAFQARYFADHVAKLKPSMQSAQETIWRVSLLPTLGTMPLDKIDAEVITKLTSMLLKERQLSPKSVNNALSALRTALDRAEAWKLIDIVPRVSWLKVPQQKFDFFTFEETRSLMAVGHPMVVTALKTGMRIGELLALDWSNVSLDRRAVTVERSVFWEKGKAHEGSTKTGSIRSLRLTGEVVAALTRLAPNPKQRKGYVFTDEHGAQLTRNACKWPLWRTLKAAQVRRAGWHVCRHSFASHLVMKGVPLAAVQLLMGHTTITMTMRYAHLAPDHLRSAMAVLEAVPELDDPEASDEL
jgi:integrase